MVNQLRVELVGFPITVLNEFRKLTDEVLEEVSAKDPMAKKVNANFKNFKKDQDNWGFISERAYYQYMAANPETLEPWVNQPVYEY